MKPFSQFTAAEKRRFDKSFLETRNAIEDAMLLIQDAIHSTGDVQGKWQLQLAYDALESQLMAHNLEYDAIVRDGFGVTPPTKAQVDEIVTLAQQVAAEAGNAGRAQAVVSIARQALSIYNRLK